MDPHQTKIFTAILVAAGVLGIVVSYFIITIIKNQRRHLKLQQKSLLIEITTLENERKRIVSDLHDELGPLLSVVKLQVADLQTQIADDLQLIQKATDNLDTLLERIRGICNQLMPQVLVRKGLIIAIREFILELDSRSRLNLEFNCESDVIVPAKAEIHLYRMIQEIVNNAVKHSQAESLTIDMKNQNEKLVVTISDNGKGFDAGNINIENAGFGLKNILSRVDILSGDLYLDARPGKGTTYNIEIPNTKPNANKYPVNHC